MVLNPTLKRWIVGALLALVVLVVLMLIFGLGVSSGSGL